MGWASGEEKLLPLHSCAETVPWQRGPSKAMLCRCNCLTKVLPTASQLLPSGPRATVWSRQVHYLVAGADVQQDREALLWVDPSARRVQGQLAHRDAHAIAAQVSQAQDALPISHHHGLKNRAGRHQSPAALPVTEGRSKQLWHVRPTPGCPLPLLGSGTACPG